MAARKYQHLVTDFTDLEMRRPFFDGKAHMVVEYDARSYKDTSVWMHSSLVYQPGCGMGAGDYWERILPNGSIEPHVASRHRHNSEEIFLFLGTNPEKPNELGGEVKVWIGKDEDEELYIITKPSVIYIPADTWHNPTFYTKVDFPFIEVVLMPGQNTVWDDNRYLDKTQDYPTDFLEMYGKYVDPYRPTDEHMQYGVKKRD